MEENINTNPIIVLTNSQLLSSTERQARKELYAQDTVTLSPLEKAYDARDRRHSEQIVKSLETHAINDNEIDPDILDFTSAAQVYFQGVAEREGLVPNATPIDFRIKMIPEKAWKEEYSNGVQAPAGFFNPESHSIYISYPSDINDDNKFNLCLIIFHELRHRVGKMVAITELEQTEGTVRASKVDIRPALNLFNDDKMTNFMEEIFTAGYMIDHVGEVDSPFFRSQYEKLLQERERRKARGDFPDYLPLDVLDSFTSYLVYGRIYLDMKKRIPEFEDLCVSVRRGKKGSRHALAQRIENEFGREGLAALIYGNLDRAGNVRVVLSYGYDALHTTTSIDPEDSKKFFEAERDEYLREILS